MGVVGKVVGQMLLCGCQEDPCLSLGMGGNPRGSSNPYFQGVKILVRLGFGGWGAFGGKAKVVGESVVRCHESEGV